MKKQVNICDVCNKAVSEKKCEVCDKDICPNCEDDLGIGLAEGGILFYVTSCNKCAPRLEKAKLKQFFDEDVNKDIRRKIIKVFKNANILDSLENEGEDKKERIIGGGIWKKLSGNKTTALQTTAESLQKLGIGISGRTTSNFKTSLKGGRRRRR